MNKEKTKVVFNYRLPYDTPRLEAFGSLVGMTRSGSGTKVEGFTLRFYAPFIMACAGGNPTNTSPGTKYPCF